MKIGFIGCGNMASAIISGVLSKNAINENDINIFDIYSPACEKIKEKFDVNICECENDIVQKINRCICDFNTCDKLEKQLAEKRKNGF